VQAEARSTQELTATAAAKAAAARVVAIRAAVARAAAVRGSESFRLCDDD